VALHEFGHWLVLGHNDNQFAGRRFELQAIQNRDVVEHYVFALPVTFTVTYPDQAGLDEENLTLLYAEEALQRWTPAACGNVHRNPPNNEISVPVCHLGEFALFNHQAQARSLVFLPIARR